MGVIIMGTTLLITILSIINGFSEVGLHLYGKNNQSHQLHKVDFSRFIPDLELENSLKNYPLVVDFSSFIEGYAMAQSPYINMGVISIKGISSANIYGRVEYHFGKDYADSLQSQVFNSRIRLYIDDQTAKKYALIQGDIIQLTALNSHNIASNMINLMRRTAVISVVFPSKTFLVSQPILMNTNDARKLFRYRKDISGYDLIPAKANLSKEDYDIPLNPIYTITTPRERLASLYDAKALEKWVSYIFFIFISAIALVNILISFVVNTLLRRRDFAILIAMGFAPSKVAKVFLYQGLFIGVVCAVLGIMFGLCLVWIQDTYEVLQLSDNFLIKGYPVSLSLMDIFYVAIGTITGCFFMAWYPFHKTVKTSFINILRYEG